MIQSKEKFMLELETLLIPHENKQGVLEEYEGHILDLLDDSEVEEIGELTDLIHNKIGTPEEIAAIWNEEWSVTPSKTQWIFVSANIFLFVGGSLLTILYNVFSWEWLQGFWARLTDIPAVIIAVYIVFWVLLGYEIGKEFGSKGKTLLVKTLVISLVPNLVLMNLVLFHLIPHEWFDPLLSKSFILICMGFTVLLLPISWAGYKWGRRASV
jgi:hypothetical protein